MQNLLRYKTKNKWKILEVLMRIVLKAYCNKAKELYEKFCDCYTTEQVTTVIDDQLNCIQANKISVKGNLFFILNQYLPLLNILEGCPNSISVSLKYMFRIS